ncbi:hypothetical protein F4819DRAFT_490134 [Hypoxylon fuscum]|nr:hypothetical protein F4819DRAFT_490134 [Hypoxylon fuscum]
MACGRGRVIPMTTRRAKEEIYALVRELIVAGFVPLRIPIMQDASPTPDKQVQ